DDYYGGDEVYVANVTPGAVVFSQGGNCNHNCRQGAVMTPSGHYWQFGGVSYPACGMNGSGVYSFADFYRLIPQSVGVDVCGASLGTMSKSRNFNPAVLLPSGKVFLPGGETASCGMERTSVFASADMVDPFVPGVIGTFTLDAGFAGHTATSLQTGDVLLAGGAIG